MEENYDAVLDKLRREFTTNLIIEEEFSINVNVPEKKGDYMRLIDALMLFVKELMQHKVFKNDKKIYIHISYEK